MHDDCDFFRILSENSATECTKNERVYMIAGGNVKDELDS